MAAGIFGFTDQVWKMSKRIVLFASYARAWKENNLEEYYVYTNKHKK